MTAAPWPTGAWCRCCRAGSLPDLPVYAVTPRRGEQPAKVRHALALLAAHFDLLPGPAAG
jgi:hypothetical protein